MSERGAALRRSFFAPQISKTRINEGERRIIQKSAQLSRKSDNAIHYPIPFACNDNHVKI